VAVLAREDVTYLSLRDMHMPADLGAGARRRGQT